MNTHWTDFLNTQDLSHTLTTNKQIIAPLSHLAILSVSGQDASDFLQGQTTCNIKTLSDSIPQLGAFCNAKGRTISTFIVVKQTDTLQLILPSDLLASVKKRLTMYILRSDVKLTDQSENLCIIGLYKPTASISDHLLPYPEQAHSFLFFAPPDEAQSFWSNALTHEITAINADAWLNLDIQAGIPWLTPATTEKFVPQMLNLDKLNAISFEKGCYTGQEIVARTHYLGKNKRVMYQAHCSIHSDVTPGCTIIDSSNPDAKQGEVILVAPGTESLQLLVVLKETISDLKNLQLNNQNQDKMTLNIK